MTKREMMVKAHGMARKMVGNYAARLSLALRELWDSVKRGVAKVEELIGSEKQVKWANDIRKMVMEGIENFYEKYPFDLSAKMKNRISEFVKSQNTAKFWIDNKANDAYSFISHVIEKYDEEIYELKGLNNRQISAKMKEWKAE